MSQISSSKILAVIVLYHCNLADSKAFQSLSSFAGINFFVHCNSEDCQVTEDMSVETFNDFSNPGVSLAYNRAATYAYDYGYEYLLFADQDSTFPPEFLDNFYAAFQDHPQQQIFLPEVWADSKLISPVLFKYARAWYADPQPQYGVIELDRYRPINTGLIITTKAFQKIGGYDARVFLDYSDFVFAGRCSKKGFAGVFFNGVVKSELSDFKVQTWQDSWTRYRQYLRSTLPLLGNPSYLALPFWWLCRFCRLLVRHS